MEVRRSHRSPREIRPRELSVSRQALDRGLADIDTSVKEPYTGVGSVRVPAACSGGVAPPPALLSPAIGGTRMAGKSCGRGDSAT